MFLFSRPGGSIYSNFTSLGYGFSVSGLCFVGVVAGSSGTGVYNHFLDFWEASWYFVGNACSGFLYYLDMIMKSKIQILGLLVD